MHVSAFLPDRRISPADPANRASCLPVLWDVDWARLAETPFICLGTGAVGRPLAISLAWLGMRRAVLVDRKCYKPQSVISQCDPAEVGREKALVVAERLAALGVAASPWHCDIDELPPGIVEPDAVLVAALDNRLADVAANRLAARMRVRLVKVNVEPAYLTASLRFYDFRRPPVEVCAECQMTESHYAQQRHPQSCDGGGPEQPTGSPRPLCELAGNAAALALAQFVGSPARWAPMWRGTQWQQSLLGGRGGTSRLAPKTDCRWDHSEHWPDLVRLRDDPARTTLRDLFRAAGAETDLAARVRFSARVATAARCARCHARRAPLLQWVARLDKPVDRCSCSAPLFAEPFSTRHALPASGLFEVLDQPLAAWGVPALSIFEIESGDRRRALVVGPYEVTATPARY